MFKDYGKNNVISSFIFWIVSPCMSLWNSVSIHMIFLTSCFYIFQVIYCFIKHKAKLLGLIFQFLKYEPKGGTNNYESKNKLL